MNPSQIRAVVRAFKQRVTTEIFPGRDEVPEDHLFRKARPARRGHPENHLGGVRQGLGIRQENHLQGRGHGRGEHQRVPQRPTAAHRRDRRTDWDRHRHQARRVSGLHANGRARVCCSTRCADAQYARSTTTTSGRSRPARAEKGQTKEYCVLVDAVGSTDEDVVLAESKPITDGPPVALQTLLRDIATGLTDDDNLRSAALRLVRLQQPVSQTTERDDFAATAAGAQMTDIVTDLRNATDPTLQLATARGADWHRRAHRGRGPRCARVPRRRAPSRNCAAPKFGRRLSSC